MGRQVQPFEPRRDDGAALSGSLSSKLLGDVRFDPLWRTLYATDASIYEIIPLGVVLPRNVDDVVTTVRECHDRGISIIARGGGTGLTGGALGEGVQIDLSRYMNRMPSALSSGPIRYAPDVHSVFRLFGTIVHTRDAIQV